MSASATTPTAARSQNLTSPFGKLLRFNEDGTIPADNPFFNTQQGQARAIWAFGLRNPFTFAVQPVTGRIHINDVGEGTWEEINVGAAGANYGWPNSEGPDNVSGSIVAPLFAYKHSAAVPPGSGPGGFFTGFSIAGGAFYPATGNFPAPYRGNYFFADFVSKFVGRLDLANDNAAYAFASISDSPVDMLVGTDGALYVLGAIERDAHQRALNGAGGFSRVEPSCGPAAVVARCASPLAAAAATARRRAQAATRRRCRRAPTSVAASPAFATRRCS